MEDELNDLCDAVKSNLTAVGSRSLDKPVIEYRNGSRYIRFYLYNKKLHAVASRDN